MRSLLAALLACISTSAVAADDWPRWRGPDLNGISKEKNWSERWPDKGPSIAWRATVGIGFSSLSVSQGRLYTMGHKDGKDTIHCLDALTGKPRWSHSYPAALGDQYFEGGPTSTPTVHEGRVYALSRAGELFCLAADSGKVHWTKNLPKDSGIRLPGWGLSSAVVIHDNMLLVNFGKSGMALTKDGKILWQSENDEAGYTTPVPFRRGNDSLALFTAGNSISAVDLRTGKPRWSLRWITRYGVNSADPIVAGDQVFFSSGYNKGAALLKLTAAEPTEVWRSKNMRTQLNPCVLLDGFLYGVDGDTDKPASLRCLDWKTGKVRWTHEKLGSGALMAADGKLIVLSDSGELLIAPALPESFKPTARARVLEGKCWTVPVLANGRIYCRSAAGDLVCVDARGKRSAPLQP